MARRIHPSTIIEDGARIGENVTIGPFCQIGGDVELGDDVEILSHVVVSGRTKIGARTRIFPFSSIGHQPQDLKYHGELSTLSIGEDCLVREGVTMNSGTEGGGMATVIGDRCSFFANSHVAHDCHVGDNVIFANNVMLAGHTRIGDFVYLGGGSGVFQHTRVGAHAFVCGFAFVTNDVIPYGMAVGNPACLAGLNLVGLKRRGFEREAIHDLRRAYRLLFATEGTFSERVEDVAAEFSGHPQVRNVLDFVYDGGDRAIMKPRQVPETQE